MDKLKKLYYNFDVYIQKHPSKFLIGLFILFCISIIL
jgi:hypothetical protein